MAILVAIAVALGSLQAARPVPAEAAVTPGTGLSEGFESQRGFPDYDAPYWSGEVTNTVTRTGMRSSLANQDRGHSGAGYSGTCHEVPRYPLPPLVVCDLPITARPDYWFTVSGWFKTPPGEMNQYVEMDLKFDPRGLASQISGPPDSSAHPPTDPCGADRLTLAYNGTDSADRHVTFQSDITKGAWYSFTEEQPASDLDLSAAWVKFSVGVRGKKAYARVDDGLGHNAWFANFDFGDLEQFDAFGDPLADPTFICPLTEAHIHGPDDAEPAYFDDFDLRGHDYQGPDRWPRRNRPQVGDPVDLTSGNAMHSWTDLSVASKGPALALTRSYNNMDECSDYGVIGCDWTTNLDEHVIDFGTFVSWVRPDGSAERFADDDGDGVFEPPPGNNDVLERRPDGSFAATDIAGETHTFGSEGRLESVRDRFGEGYDLLYHAPDEGCDENGENCAPERGLLDRAVSTSGAWIDLQWQTIPGVVSYRAENLVLRSATTSAGIDVTYTYEAANPASRLLGVTGEGGITTGYEYDDFGDLSALIDSSGRKTFEQQYDSVGQVASQRDGLGNESTYVYDAGAGAFADPMGAETVSTWGEMGFEESRRSPDGATTRFGYSSHGYRSDITDATGAWSRTEYSEGGDPISATDPLGNTSTSHYRADHQPEWTEDPTGTRTTYDYLDSGALSSISASGAGTTMFWPNTDGTVSATMSPDGVISRTEYDTYGRPVAQIDAAGRRTTTVYNPDGTVTATIAPDGTTSTTYYDAARRPSRVRDPLGATSSFGYDASGNQNAVTDTLGHATNFGYDAAYNLYETSTTIEGGQVVDARFSYDAANRLSSVRAPGGSGTSGYAYTPSGNLKTTTDADGATWSYDYSSRGEMTESVGPDGSVTRYSYDAAGRMVSTVNQREGETTYSYNAAGRPLAVQSSDGHGQIYQYDSAGRMSASADTTNLKLIDGEPKAFGLTQTLSPGGRRVSHAQGRFAYSGGALTPEETSQVAYFYRDDGAIDSMESDELIGPGAVSNSYDETTGRLASQSAPGSSAIFEYDGVGRMAEMTTTTGAGVSLGYQTRYDLAGNVISMGGSTYTYDALGRLVTAHDGELGDNYEYQYDLASNRTQVKKNGEITQSLGFTTADEIDTAAYPEFVYDQAGRLISDTTPAGSKRTYHWDGYGRLSGVDLYMPATGQSENVRYSYDANGRLAEKRTYLDLTWPIERLFYHYDGDRLVSEEDMTGTVREYLYAGGEAPTAMRARQSDGSYKNYFFVTNTHGDVVALTDKDGTIVNSYAYGPWGEATRVSETVHQPFRYAGYRYEDGFDLYYLRARWYDASTGRFLTRDPLGPSMHDSAQMNQYVYGADAPSTKTDPDGYSPRSTDVVTFLSGVSSPEETALGWLDFLDWYFPESQALVYTYTLPPHMVGYDEPLVRELSARYKAEVGGRRLYALGHSWGGVLAFKISSRASLNIPLAITMGSPLYRKGFGAINHIRHWVAICSDSDEICDAQHLEQYKRRDPVYGADEVVVPGGLGHSGYHDSELIKKLIVAKMRRFGAR